jgi:hypothetical protein
MLGNNLYPVGAVDVSAFGGGGDIQSITKVTQGGGAVIDSPSILSVALRGADVVVALRVAPLASNKPRAVVIGRRQCTRLVGTTLVFLSNVTFLPLATGYLLSNSW